MREESIIIREEQLKARLDEIARLEAEIKMREKALKTKEGAKKQILLRLSPGLWEDITRWAEEDFRSINGQIEYILANAVRKRKG